jgi:TRAP-type C4-dicarboxylate transport system permease small subunit
MTDILAPEIAEPKPGAAPAHSVLGIATMAFNALGTCLLFAQLIAINGDVISQAALNQPLIGVTEMVTLAFVAIVFLQLPYALRTGRITVSDTLFTKLKRASPRTASIVSLIYNALGAAIVGLVVYAVWPDFWKAWEDDLFIGAIGNFTAPIWPTILAILVGCALTAVQFLALVVHDARNAFTGSGRS